MSLKQEMEGMLTGVGQKGGQRQVAVWHFLSSTESGVRMWEVGAVPGRSQQRDSL